LTETNQVVILSEPAEFAAPLLRGKRIQAPSRRAWPERSRRRLYFFLPSPSTFGQRMTVVMSIRHGVCGPGLEGVWVRRRIGSGSGAGSGLGQAPGRVWGRLRSTQQGNLPSVATPAFPGQVHPIARSKLSSRAKLKALPPLLQSEVLQNNPNSKRQPVLTRTLQPLRDGPFAIPLAFSASGSRPETSRGHGTEHVLSCLLIPLDNPNRFNKPGVPKVMSSLVLPPTASRPGR
jgi:hypothetical protein